MPTVDARNLTIATETDGQAALASLLRDLARLAATVLLDRQTEPTRVLPVLPPAALWRCWPRMLRRAADLAEAMPVCPITRTEVEFMRAAASAIDRPFPAPAVGVGRG